LHLLLLLSAILLRKILKLDLRYASAKRGHSRTLSAQRLSAILLREILKLDLRYAPAKRGHSRTLSAQRLSQFHFVKSYFKEKIDFDLLT
jgi:hypothetical protein